MPGAGFAFADDALPGVLWDAKYAGCENFMGRPAKGYEVNRVVLSDEVAAGLVRARARFHDLGYELFLFDAYRPQRAVDDFVAWGKDLADVKRKAIQYPNVSKADLFRLGYIGAKSGHTRGCAVDLTLVSIATGERLDMATSFDFMDPRSGHNATDLTDAQKANRELLRQTMLASGFADYDAEWWHYSIVPDPHPGEYFDFPIA